MEKAPISNLQKGKLNMFEAKRENFIAFDINQSHHNSAVVTDQKRKIIESRDVLVVAHLEMCTR